MMDMLLSLCLKTSKRQRFCRILYQIYRIISRNNKILENKESNLILLFKEVLSESSLSTSTLNPAFPVQINRMSLSSIPVLTTSSLNSPKITIILVTLIISSPSQNTTIISKMIGMISRFKKLTKVWTIKARWMNLSAVISTNLITTQPSTTVDSSRVCTTRMATGKFLFTRTLTSRKTRPHLIRLRWWLFASISLHCIRRKEVKLSIWWPQSVLSAMKILWWSSIGGIYQTSWYS